MRNFVAWACALNVGAAASASAPLPQETDLARLQTSVPGDVCVHAIYRSARSSGAGETHVGYNCVTGAWYHVTTGHVHGRDDDGKMFWASVDGGEALSEVRYSEDTPGRDFGVDRYFPKLILMDLVHNRPELIQAFGPGEGGNVVLVARLPGGIRHTSEPSFGAMSIRDYCIEVDAKGNVVRTWVGPDAAELSTYEFEYSPDSPEGFPVALRDPLSKFELSSLDVTTAVRDFDAQAAVKRHELAKSNVASALAELAAQRTPGSR